MAARARCSPKTIPSTLRTIDSCEPFWIWRLAPWIAVTPPTSARISAYRSWMPVGQLCGSRSFCGVADEVVVGLARPARRSG